MAPLLVFRHNVIMHNYLHDSSIWAALLSGHGQADSLGCCYCGNVVLISGIIGATRGSIANARFTQDFPECAGAVSRAKQ